MRLMLRAKLATPGIKSGKSQYKVGQKDFEETEMNPF